MVGSKHVFWQALVFTIFIFSLGLVLGFFLEVARSSTLEHSFANSEISLLDQQLRGKVGMDFPVACGSSINSTFTFADTIYNEASDLEDYDAASKLSDSLPLLHRRYDLLRTMLWLESIELKKRCNATYHTVVYLYEYKPEDVQIRAQQIVYERLTYDLKSAHPNEVLLIPIASNVDLESLQLITEHFNITSYPAVIIDEKKILTGELSKSQLETIVFQGNN